MKTGFRSRVLSGFGALVTAFLLVVPSIGAQQGGTVTGRVLDSQTGTPLAAVQVFISALDLGGLTQQNGRYLLQNVPAGTHTLTVARIGYRTTDAQVSVGGGQTVEQNFAIAEEALALDEIIVTGTPGGTQRRAIGNAVTRLDAAAVVDRVAITGIQDLLTARAPGLQYNRLSGNIGTGGGIRIRGVSSLELGAQPLIYVDGIRVNNSNAIGPDIGRDRQSSALNDFSPDEIESIEIIKGPAAATLYGTEASAGVIQIITKRGEVGAPVFNLSVRQGANYMPDPAGKLGTRYGCVSTFAPPCPAGDVISYNPYTEANKWKASEGIPGDLYGYGLSSNYNLSVRGGTEAVRYFVSADYTDDNGIVDYNFKEQTNVRANLSLILAPTLNVDISTGFVSGTISYAAPVISDGGTWQDLQWGNGFCLLSTQQTRFDRGINPVGESVPMFPDPNCSLRGFQEHLPTDVEEVDAFRFYDRFTGSGTFTHTIGDNFTQRLVAGVDKGWDTNSYFIPLDDDQRYTENVLGEVRLGTPETTVISVDWSGTYRYDVNDNFRVTSSVGTQYYSRLFEQQEVIGKGFSSPQQKTVNQTARDQLEVTYRFRENKSLGVFVQEEIGYQDRIFLTGAVRADDNSAFGSDFDLIYYPKVSGTWVLSEEEMWNIDFINSFRIRGAWGKAGRQPDVLARATLYSAFPGPGGAPGLRPDQAGNTAVGPEQSTELEIGVDFALMDDRVSGEFTWYNQKTTDALLDLDQVPSLGIPGDFQANIGRIDNWGWEAILNTRLIQTQAVGFDITWSADHTDNLIIDLAGNEPGNHAQVGHPYPNERDRILRSVEGGLDPITQEPIGTLCDPGIAREGTNPATGEAWPSNLQGGVPVDCSTIRSAQLLIGPAFATYTFSVAPTLSLLGNDLQIFAMAEGQYGKTGDEGDVEWGIDYNNSLQSQLRTDPLFVASESAFIGDDTHHAHFDASFWKLREIGARYQLPQSLTSTLGVDRASFSISGRNLFILWQKTKRLGVFGDDEGLVIPDPEHSGTQDDSGSNAGGGNNTLWGLPSIASVNATLRVTF